MLLSPLLLPFLLPFAAGVLQYIVLKRCAKGRLRTLLFFTLAGLSAVSVLPAVLAESSGMMQNGASISASLSASVSFVLQCDAPARVFSLLAAALWVPLNIYAYRYMADDAAPGRFFLFFSFSYAALQGLIFAGNPLTLYLFYEWLTLCSLPLVLHNRSLSALSAGRKYLYYSFFGAFAALGGIAILPQAGGVFSAGGLFTLTQSGASVLNNSAPAAMPLSSVLFSAFLMIFGFSAKSGLFPLHGWLPAAHPEAPSPASALLSGLIAGAGFFSVFRIVYYTFGVSVLRGSWVQILWLICILATILLGSALALSAKQLKKRLAYSTVSQMAYLSAGLALLSPYSIAGAWILFLAHAAAKSAAFLTAGAANRLTGRDTADALRTLRRLSPLLAVCFLLCGAVMTGLAPTSGFFGKFYLSVGALTDGPAYFSWLVPVVLLVSAVLTAAYFFPPVLRGLHTPDDAVQISNGQSTVSAAIWLPILLLAAAAVLLCTQPFGLADFLMRMTGGLA